MVANRSRSDEIVVRGSTAMTIVFQMTSKVSNFIEQSHLETTEGLFCPCRARREADVG